MSAENIEIQNVRFVLEFGSVDNLYRLKYKAKPGSPHFTM